CFFFFFQAEDGIRDKLVTGVQTCALPIWLMQDRPRAGELAEAVREFIETEILPSIDDPRLRFRALVAANGLAILERELAIGAPRSEERRVGKECRCRWAAGEGKNKDARLE